MDDVLDQVQRWVADGRRVALATVIGTENSAPRDPGAALAVNDEGEVAGSVSGGCVESAVVIEAMEVLEAGVPRRLSFGIGDADAFAVGLTCGGTIHLFVERVDW
jgi:xanthine dehydrogenase accessory factor